MAAPLFAINDLSVSLGTKVSLPGTLSVAGGERVALVGPSGSGKSLFLRAIAQLDPHAGGHCSLEGVDAATLQAPAWRARVSYLLPEPAFWGTRLREDFERVATLAAHRDKKLRVDDALALLEQFEIGPLLDSDPLTLSSGEKQRAALARLLWIGPQILLLDEPTAALDGAMRLKAEILIEKWVTSSAEPRAVLWITHDIEQARRYCNRYLQLQNSQIREIGMEALR